MKSAPRSPTDQPHDPPPQGAGRRESMMPFSAILAVMIVSGLATLYFTTRPVERRSSATATPISGPQPMVVALNESPRLGSKDAGLAVLEFSDFSCRYCGIFAKNTQQALIQQYVETGRLLWFFKHLPLRESSLGAAKLGACAQRHQKFWPFHDLLFANQGRFEDEKLIGYAQQAGLRADDVRACLNDDAALIRVKQDMKEATDLNVTGTPTFLFGQVKNGEMHVTHRLSGAVGSAEFSRIIETFLDTR